jgi:hypothetical protein
MKHMDKRHHEFMQDNHNNYLDYKVTSPLLAISILGIAILMFCGCQKKISDEIDFGAFTNSVYHNNYFGLTMTAPSDWSIQDQQQQQQLTAAGSKLMYGDDQNQKAVLKAAELDTVHLFAVFRYPLGSPVSFNPSVMSLAEKVSQLPGIKTGEDYLFHVKKALSTGQMQISFPTNDYTVQLGGNDFSVMESEMTINGVTVKQKFYSAIMKGYALNFIMSYTTDQDEASVQKVLDTVTFK